MVIDTGNQADRKLDELVRVAHQISAAVETVIDGKPDAIRLALTVLLAEGHVLIEDVPGVGKTLLAKALARSIDCSVRRVQFTPDLLPSDLTGVSAFNQELREFEFKPGPIFANIVLGDEINRASPKTQSALLECMEERQVTVDGATYPLELPFMVIATQNPVEMEGTYPLPEAQRDRFTARISIGYPDKESELEMLDTHGSSSPLDSSAGRSCERHPRPDRGRSRRARSPADQAVHHQPRQRDPLLPGARLGASPRATLHLLRASRAYAAIDGRDFVIPDDVQTLAVPGARAPAAAHPGRDGGTRASRAGPDQARRTIAAAARRSAPAGRRLDGQSGREGPRCGPCWRDSPPAARRSWPPAWPRPSPGSASANVTWSASACCSSCSRCCPRWRPAGPGTGSAASGRSALPGSRRASRAR